MEPGLLRCFNDEQIAFEIRRANDYWRPEMEPRRFAAVRWIEQRLAEEASDMSRVRLLAFRR